MEKMTFSLLAVFHGDDEAISEHETIEADTRQEVALKLATELESLADVIRAAFS